MNVADVDALWNTHDFSPSDRRKGVGATGHCTGYGQAGWSTKIWQEREEEGEAGANGVKGETHFTNSRVAKRKSRNMSWVMRVSAMGPCCAGVPGKVNVYVMWQSVARWWFAPFTRALRFSHQHKICPTYFDASRWCKIWMRDIVML